MSQIALPLKVGSTISPPRIIVGSANQQAVEALGNAETWPFRTAVLTGPPRSGKSLLARWFAGDLGGKTQGLAVDSADSLDETELFHRWNAAQETGQPLLLVSNAIIGEWAIALPDLRSRIGAALHLTIGAPDDAMLAELIQLHGEMRGIVLDDTACAYLVPRAERSHLGAELLVAAIDRLSLERKAPPGQSIWRDALEEIAGAGQPRLL